MQFWADRVYGYRAIAGHLACILLLMWPAIVNRQALIFPDTTSYIRAADLAVHLASKGHISTAWTDRYRSDLQHAQPIVARGPTSAAHIVPGNDVGSGNIMSGRSPYFGALLYIGYVTSDFWLFVLAQAAVAYWLIFLSLRIMGVARSRWTVPAVVSFVALFTSLPFYTTLLLADALTGFGMVAVAILAVDRGRLTRIERSGLVLLMLVSALSHLTHIFIIMMMAAVLILFCLMRRDRWPNYRFAVVSGVVTVLIGLISVSLTSFVILKAFKHPPQLVPLLTSRLIEEGPGRDFIRAGCDGGRFAVCHLPGADNRSALEFLWATDPAHGTFMPARPAVRRTLSAEDTRFALAVMRAYPLRSVIGMLQGTAAQLIDFRMGSLSQNCFARADCWVSLPNVERERLRNSLAGRNGWPVGALNVLSYTVVIASLIFTAALLPALWRSRSVAAGDLRIWLLLLMVAMLANAFLCGAVSIPQYRYQGRIIWLLPFYAILLTLVLRSRESRPASQPAPAL